jgi:hypothetical protein
MPVYEGVLEQLSGGVNHLNNNYVRREYIDIGGKHLRNIALTSYHDELLQDALGQEVALSIAGTRGGAGKKSVIALRTPKRGVSKACNFPSLFFTLLVSTVLWWIGGVIMAFIAWAIVATVLDLKGNANVVLLGGLMLFALMWPLVRSFKIFRAWGALKSRAPVHPSPDAVVTSGVDG